MKAWSDISDFALPNQRLERAAEAKKRWVYVWYLTIKNMSINRKIIVDGSEIIRHKNGEFPIYIEGVKVKK